MSEPIDVTPYTPEQLFAAEMANDLPPNMKARALPRIRATVRALADARADNARHRALIKAQEFGNHEETASGRGDFCPWCNEEDGHRADCPAFTPDGEVK